MENRREYLVEENSSFKKFNFVDTEKKIDQLSRITFINEDKTILYPFGYEGGQKYLNIETMEVIGFKRNFPVGLFKSVNYGWGFTRPLAAFAKYIDEDLEINKVIIIKDGTNTLDLENKILTINGSFLKDLNTILTHTIKQCKEEIKDTVLIELNRYFPKDISRPEKKYQKDDLTKVLRTWGNDIEEFSDSDKEEIINLFNKLSVTPLVNLHNVTQTKQILEKKYIENSIEEFESLLASTSETPTLEKKWQTFLQKHNWIFSTIFAQPIILFQREAYVGGKTVDNSDGKFADFLLKNNLSNNVSFFEIKTHLTKLTEDKPYRGSDVYGASKELCGCINQVLNQRDNFQKEFYSLKYKSKSEIETFNSECIVLIGNLSILKPEQLKSFELFRANYKNVNILTFDEVLNKLKIFLSLLG